MDGWLLQLRIYKHMTRCRADVVHWQNVAGSPPGCDHMDSRGQKNRALVETLQPLKCSHIAECVCVLVGLNNKKEHKTVRSTRRGPSGNDRDQFALVVLASSQSICASKNKHWKREQPALPSQTSIFIAALRLQWQVDETQVPIRAASRACQAECALCASAFIMTFMSTLLSPGLNAVPCSLTRVTQRRLLNPFHLIRSSYDIKYEKMPVISALFSSVAGGWGGWWRVVEGSWRAPGQSVKVTLYQHLAQSDAQPAWNWYSSKSPANYASGASVVAAENVWGWLQSCDKLHCVIHFKCNMGSDLCFSWAMHTSVMNLQTWSTWAVTAEQSPNTT